jgi:hypothetical protein
MKYSTIIGSGLSRMAAERAVKGLVMEMRLDAAFSLEHSADTIYSYDVTLEHTYRAAIVREATAFVSGVKWALK